MDSSTQWGPLLTRDNLAVLAKGSSTGLLGQGQEGVGRGEERRQGGESMECGDTMLTCLVLWVRGQHVH